MSLWIGNFRTKQSLKEYVEIKFDEVGDRIQSKFMRDFNIDFIDYNQDLLESTLIEGSTTSLTTLLSGSSYEAWKFYHNLWNIMGKNCQKPMILLLDYMILSTMEI